MTPDPMTPDPVLPDPVLQQVTSTAGFAYGAVGADIHVFGDGTPLYVLEAWLPGPRPDPEWLREVPSRMLNARFSVVEFTGRHDELAALHEWRQQRPRLSARWLHGPGGVGKTRLAAQFAAESVTAGWKVVVATHGPGTVLPPPGSQDLRLDGAPGVLLVVDYADRWPHSHLTWLFSNAMLHRPEVPARILLLGRTADAWPSVRGALANQQASTSSQALAPLPATDASRVRMYDAARDSFARHYQAEGDLPATGELGDDGFGLTLTVHMRALVAVDAHVAGRRPPTDMAGLTLYLLDREHQHWANLHSAGRVSTAPEVMNRAVFAAALTGATSPERGLRVLQDLDVAADARQALTDHATCYPPSAPGQVLEPLLPDRLAEDFLALSLPGHPADYPAQRWAPRAADRLWDTEPPARALTFLAAATDRWPHVGDAYLYPLLLARPGLARDAGSGALTTLAAITDVDLTVLDAVDGVLPRETFVDLDVGAAAVSERLIPGRLAADPDPVARANLRMTYGWRLSHVGRTDEALAEMQEALTLLRPTGHLPSLVRALNSTVSLTGTRSSAPQIELAEESLAAARRLAEPVALAVAVSNLATLLSRVPGRSDQALTLTVEAVALRRQLAASDADSDLADLGTSLSNLANRYRERGARDDALAAAEEALSIRRGLAAKERGQFVNDLATSLSNLVVLHTEAGRAEQGAAAGDEAVRIWRELATVNPGAYLPDLAGALINLASCQRALRQPAALDHAQEALAIVHRLAEADPARYGHLHAVTLTLVVGLLVQAGRHAEALPHAEAAVALHRQLADPAELAESLVSLGVRRYKVGQLEASAAAAREAASMFQRLAETDPARFLPRQVSATRNLSTCLVELGAADEAVAAKEAVVAVRTRLADRDPAQLGEVVMDHSELSELLWSLGRHAAAIRALDESVRLARRLMSGNPAGYRVALAMLLWRACAYRLKAATDLAGARTAIEDSIELYQGLSPADREKHHSDYVMAWQLYASVLDASGQGDAAAGIRRRYTS